MIFHKIDIETWNRKKTYNQFLNNLPCTYSMTINLDITNLMAHVKAEHLKFFPTMLHGMTTAVNAHQAFRMDLDENGHVGFYEQSNPCYTVFHPETETFTDVWTEFDTDMRVFVENYMRDMAQYEADSENSKPPQGGNTFNVSCLPWASFTGFNLNLQHGYSYFPPIFTVGKYFKQGERLLIPIAIQVHHAVCDGFHVGQFVETLQNWANTFGE